MPLERLEILDEVQHFLIRQAEFEEAVVVIDYVAQSREPAVVIEPAFGVSPEST